MRLIIFSIFFFLSGLDDTLIFPFLPNLKLFQNYPKFIISVIYGCYPGMMIITSFLFGNFIYKYSPINLMVITLLLKSVFSYSFGCVEFIETNYLSVAVIFISRLALASMSALGTTVILSLIASDENLQNVSQKFGVLELAFGIGAVLGPILGAALHQIGGFLAPLYFTSFLYALLLLMQVVDSRNSISPPLSMNQDSPVIKTLTRNKLWWLISISVSFGLLAVGCLAQSFFQFLYIKLGLSETVSSLCYICGPVSYSFACPLIGALSRAQFADGNWLLKLGILMNGLGFLLLGPVPISKISSRINILCSVMGNLIFGVGLALIVVPGFTLQMALSRHLGLLQNSNLYCQLSGIFNTLQSLGLTVGPILGEIISLQISFQWMSTIIGSGFIILFILFVVLTNPTSQSADLFDSNSNSNSKIIAKSPEFN